MIEVGFGAGDLINRIAPFVDEGFIAGVDFSPDMAELCTKRFATLVRSGRVELRCASVEGLPYDADRFTKACTVNTVYFWPDPAVALCELWRVLRVDGRLVVGFSRRATMRTLAVTKHGFTFYEPDQIPCLLEGAGFDSIEMIPGSGPRGAFICAIATKPGPECRPVGGSSRQDGFGKVDSSWISELSKGPQWTTRLRSALRG